MHPQTRRRDLNREKLRSSALREFASYGLGEAKISCIVAAADLTQPSFYRLWQSKEQAFYELLWDSQAFVRQALKEHMVQFAKTNPSDCFMLGTRWLMEQIIEHRDLIHLAQQHLLFDQIRRRDLIEAVTENFHHLRQLELLKTDLDDRTVANVYYALFAHTFHDWWPDHQDDPVAIADPLSHLFGRFLQTASQPSP